MNAIGLIGYGELGRQIENLLRSCNKHTQFVYFDDLAYNNGVENSRTFLSYINEEYKDFIFYVCIGYKYLKIKSEIFNKLKASRRNIGSYFHPTAYIDKSAQIDVGTIIYPNVTVDKDVVIGMGCVLNLSVTIAHNTSIGHCCYLSPSVTTSGFVKISNYVFVGSGTVFSNNVEVGEEATIGIGSVITKNVKPGTFVIGNPQCTVRKLTI